MKKLVISLKTVGESLSDFAKTLQQVKKNNVIDCLDQPPVMALITMLDSCRHETLGWPHLYKSDPEFDNIYQTLLEGKEVPDFHLQNALL